MERLQERPRVAAAEEAARVRDAEATRRACTRARRSRRSRSRSRRRGRPARLEPAYLVRDRLGDAGDRIGAARDEPRNLLVRSLPRARGSRVVAPVLVRDDRIAQIGDPARTGRSLDGRSDEVDRRRRRGRDHGVDALASRDADRRGDRGEVPRHARIGEEQTTRRDLRLHKRTLEAVGRAQLLGGLPRARAEVPRAMDPGLSRHAQVGIAVDPLRVVGREDVGLDAERRQVLRELERSLHPSAAGGREVHRHEQHLHGREA